MILGNFTQGTVPEPLRLCLLLFIVGVDRGTFCVTGAHSSATVQGYHHTVLGTPTCMERTLVKLVLQGRLLART